MLCVALCSFTNTQCTFQDNIGSPDSFTPTCLITSEYEGAKVSCDTKIDGSPLHTSGWAFKMVIFYAVRVEHWNETQFFKQKKCGLCGKAPYVINKNQKDEKSREKIGTFTQGCYIQQIKRGKKNRT